MKKLKKQRTCTNKNSGSRKRKMHHTTKNTGHKNVSRKNKFVDADIENSSFEVFVAVYITKNDEPVKLVKFETDINRLIDAIDHTKNTNLVKRNEEVHDRLAEILNNINEPLDELETTMVNYLATCDAEFTLANHPDQPIGFSVKFDVDDYTSCEVIGAMKIDMEEMFNVFIGNFSLVA